MIARETILRARGDRAVPVEERRKWSVLIVRCSAEDILKNRRHGSAWDGLGGGDGAASSADEEDEEAEGARRPGTGARYLPPEFRETQLAGD